MINKASELNAKDYMELWFYDLKRIGCVARKRILEKFGSIEEIFYADRKHFTDVVNDSQCEEIISYRDIMYLEAHYGSTLDKGINILCENHEDYPDKLKNIADPPGIIFIKGNFKKALSEGVKNLAMVGGRKAGSYGKELAYLFANKLAKAGINIISGLALGIDGISHKGALDAGGYTLGVLGCGIDIVYPRVNYELYEKMNNSGCIISEYGLGEPGNKINFPRRNRIISAMSDGVLVIEAAQKSGSLITADFALEQGKQVYTIPGRVYDRGFEGSNNLIKQGAIMVTAPEDILLDMIGSDALKSENISDEEKILLAPIEKMVYSCLSLEPVYIDDIVSKLNIGVSSLISILYSLEKRGIIKQILTGYYIINIQ